MRRVRNFVFAVALGVLIMACSLGGRAVPASGENVATIVASTLQALTPAVPPTAATSAVAQPQGIPVQYRNVGFVLPIGLAADAAPELVPTATEQNGGPWDAAPEHIRFRLDNYNVPANTFSVQRIDIYPADAYGSANAGANISLQRLKGVLADPSASLTNEKLPQVPYFNAASMFAAQVHRIHFADGDGVRMLTQYGQAVGPVANNGTFYHFEGLTSDGRYYIVAVLPVQAPFLQNGNEPNASLPAGGIPFPGYENMGDQQVYETYFGAVGAKLDATPADQFSPSLAALDAMLRSFNVSP